MKILLVRLRLIGDVVFTTPLIRAIRRQYPDARLTYLVEPTAAPVVTGNPHLDEVVVIRKRRGFRRWRDDIAMVRRLRADAFDVAIDLHGGPRAALLTWASGAPMRIGYTATGRTWIYTHPVPRLPEPSSNHSVITQWRLLAPLGIGEADPTSDPVEMGEDPVAAARVDARLRAFGITPSHTLVVIHVSAGNPFRRWPAESFVDLVVGLAQNDGDRSVLLTSGPSEKDAAGHIAAAARQRLGARADHVVNDAEFGVAELRALASRSAVYIGGDSGPLHIAATTHTPIVALFGPTMPERSMPWRAGRWFAESVDAGPLPCRPCRQRICEPGDFRCLTRIAPERVMEAAERALAARRSGPTNHGAPPTALI